MRIRPVARDKGRLFVNDDFSEVLRHNGLITGKRLWELSGDSVKNVVKTRGTERIYLEPPFGTEYVEVYLKRYRPVKITEKLKNLISLKPQPTGAFHEWDALVKFHELGIPTTLPVAAGKTGSYSCMVTLGIKDYVRASVLLKDITREHFVRRRTLIEKIARIAADIHSNGMAHQDMYLVHFFVKENEEDEVYIIDLQRVIFSNNLADRWRVKDLAQLLFSARPLVSATEILRFWKTYAEYTDKALYRDKKLVRKIFAKAARIKAHSEKNNL